MKIKIGLLVASALAIGSGFSPGDNNDLEIIPLWGIRVQQSGLTYSNITVTPQAAATGTQIDLGVINANEIPLSITPVLKIVKPSGFIDSAGFIKYGCELNLLDATGKSVTKDADIFLGLAPKKNQDLNSIDIPFKLSVAGKIDTKMTLKGKVWDKKGKGYIDFQYTFKVLPASKKLPNKVELYNKKDSRGMFSNSSGLRFNFFEFKGIPGNNFLFKIGKASPIVFLLKGLDGWKIAEDKAKPKAEIVLLDKKGNEIESDSKILDKLPGQSIPKDKKELEFKFKPAKDLTAGESYFVWLKLRDANSPKNALDLIVKIYAE
jgi:hypothetical protein